MAPTGAVTGARAAVLTFETERASVNAVAISPDGRHLVATVGGIVPMATVWLWALTNPTAEPVELTGGSAVGFLPDGRVAVAGNMVLIAHPDAPHKGAVRFALPELADVVLPDGRLLSVPTVSDRTSAPGTLIIAAVLPGATHEEIRLTLPKSAGKKPRVAVSPDGTRVAVAVELPEGARGLRRSGVRLFALPGGEPIGELDAVTGFLPELAWSPDGRYIAGVLGAKLVIWSTEDGKSRGELAAGGTRLFRGPRFHPSGRFLAAGGANIDGGVYCWNVGTWEELVGYRWPVGPIACVNFSPDGTLAVTGGEKGRILVWDVDG